MSAAVKAACPVCRKPGAEKFRPFCSARCANVDLGRWLGGGYRIPTEEEGSPDEGPGDAGSSSDDE